MWVSEYSKSCRRKMFYYKYSTYTFLWVRKIWRNVLSMYSSPAFIEVLDNINRLQSWEECKSISSITSSARSHGLWANEYSTPSNLSIFIFTNFLKLLLYWWSLLSGTALKTIFYFITSHNKNNFKYIKRLAFIWNCFAVC